MKYLIEIFEQPWPWYISGPLLGTIVPLLLIIGNKQFGVSSVFKSASLLFLDANKGKEFLKNNYWRLYFVLGAFLAGIIAFKILTLEFNDLSLNAQNYFGSKKIEINGIFPSSYFSWDKVISLRGLLLMIGGIFIGFGSRYSGGCTSGHAIMGLSQLNLGSLIAVLGFFIGGIIGTFLILDFLL